jgi:hypothetical protein
VGACCAQPFWPRRSMGAFTTGIRFATPPTRRAPAAETSCSAPARTGLAPPHGRSTGRATINPVGSAGQRPFLRRRCFVHCSTAQSAQSSERTDSVSRTSESRLSRFSRRAPRAQLCSVSVCRPTLRSRAPSSHLVHVALRSPASIERSECAWSHLCDGRPAGAAGAGGDSTSPQQP